MALTDVLNQFLWVDFLKRRELAVYAESVLMKSDPTTLLLYQSPASTSFIPITIQICFQWTVRVKQKAAYPHLRRFCRIVGYFDKFWVCLVSVFFGFSFLLVNGGFL